jgi:branched-subunit amino acid aminotransferase/4-amino-4-deoxychorismate lyase
MLRMSDWRRLEHGAWVPEAAPAEGAVAAAESWLVEDGRARGLDRHWARFARGCAEAGLSIASPRAAVEAALPATGRWFPRVEARAGGAVRLAVRPAPPRAPEVVAWIADGPDPRRAPRRKGPDLERLGALRAAAARHGAGEAVIADADGRLLEGAYTSLLWWEDDALCAVPDDAPILDGVTRALLLGLAGDAGAEVRFRRPAPAGLDGREAWLTSALHGIRVVTRWVADNAHGPPGHAGRAERAAAWQARLEALAVPVGAGAVSARDARSADPGARSARPAG